MLGPARRGTCPIRKNALQKQRQHEGIKGGKCHAGNGSSRSCIQRKMKQMEQFLFFSSPLANEAVCSDEVVSFQ
jgi:hypothetical protein